MRGVLRKTGLYVLAIFVSANFLGYVLFRSPTFTADFRDPNTIRSAVKSETATGLTGATIYLSDSVGRQLYPSSFHRNSFASAGGVTMIGHYIFVRNIAARNPGLKRVVLATIPNMIGMEFEESLTYHWLMKPFFSVGNLEHFSPLVWSKILVKPHSVFSILPAVKASPAFSDVNFSNATSYLPPHPPKLDLSDISVAYLRKLKAFTEAQGIALTIVSPPQRRSKRAETDDWRVLRDQVRELGMESILGGYLDSIRYIDDAVFHDYNHIGNPYLKTHRQELLETMLGKDIYEDLKAGSREER